eukprot:scaffold2113_cov119-Isochrysis_galbana.AAC.3
MSAAARHLGGLATSGEGGRLEGLASMGARHGDGARRSRRRRGEHGCDSSGGGGPGTAGGVGAQSRSGA